MNVGKLYLLIESCQSFGTCRRARIAADECSFFLTSSCGHPSHARPQLVFIIYMAQPLPSLLTLGCRGFAPAGRKSSRARTELRFVGFPPRDDLRGGSGVSPEFLCSSPLFPRWHVRYAPPKAARHRRAIVGKRGRGDRARGFRNGLCKSRAEGLSPPSGVMNKCYRNAYRSVTNKCYHALLGLRASNLSSKSRRSCTTSSLPCAACNFRFSVSPIWVASTTR